MTTKQKLYKIVFETDTKSGKRFDVFLLWIILFSVVTVMIESVPEVAENYSKIFFTIEWIMTIIFTIEYLLRIWISPKPVKYILSFWGIIDLLSFLPTYLRIFIFGYHYLIVIRIFRLLRVFRILKLARFNNESKLLVSALKSSMHKLGVFLVAVIAIVIFMGTIMYVVEGGKEGFTSIPQSIYWAIVTVTTVGYGDMVPHTVLGKFISSIAMIIGYAIIAVPTGIITVEMANSGRKKKACEKCNRLNESEASYCNHCGEKM
ncbi:MAG: ion transporter [Ginsengibacter sp.]